VRTLDKNIAKACRWIAKSVVKKESFPKIIQPENIKEILGVSSNPIFYENNDIAGVVTGLAWTQFGGEILFVESTLSNGKGNLSITGNIGKVMKESATIALEFIKANSNKLKIDDNIFSNYNFHIHVPEGATPKDGPSAGITMITSLVSLLTQRKVKNKLAMTGEITLRGKVLPVGGIKEKILAAKRANINSIILSIDNRKNIEEIDKKNNPVPLL
jgi:ATP-dependent Lon protease